MAKFLGPFLTVQQHVREDPNFIHKRKKQLKVDGEVCKDCLLGTHMYCNKDQCVCCFSRKRNG